MGVDTLNRVSIIFTICDFLFAFLYVQQSSSEKGVYSKRKEFAPFGSKFFPLRVDPFSEERKTILTGLTDFTGSASILLKVSKHLLSFRHHSERRFCLAFYL